MSAALVFGQIRFSAQEIWESQRVNPSDGRIWECSWQDATRQLSPADCSHAAGSCQTHVSFFCSLVDWSDNLTDLLDTVDGRLDAIVVGSTDRNYPAAPPGVEASARLFRYYTRLLLVVEQLLADLEDMYRLAINRRVSQSHARAFLTIPGGLDINKLCTYINRICKHKSDQFGQRDRLHFWNHHAPIVFEDAGYTQDTVLLSHTLLTVDNCMPTDPSAILVPSLSSILEAVCGAYRALAAALSSPLALVKLVELCGVCGPTSDEASTSRVGAP